MRLLRTTIILLLGCTIIAGCGSETPKSKSKTDPVESGSGAKSKPDSKAKSEGGTKSDNVASKTVQRRKPIGGRPVNSGTNSSNKSNGNASSGSAKEELAKLQIIVGKWRGLPRKAAGVVEVEPQWAWHFSKSGEPALAFTIKDGPYLRKGRLTYRTDDKDHPFRLEAVDKEGKTKKYEGKFSKNITDTSDDGKIVNRSFKITFQQVEPKPKAREDLYQIELAQQDNNRYLLTVHNKRGSRLRQVNVVANQRQGTSFAMKLDDYGDKTCVVSQGLGTMTVMYDGRTFYVCCSGCRAAFLEDPKKWIASFEKWKMEKAKK